MCAVGCRARWGGCLVELVSCGQKEEGHEANAGFVLGGHDSCKNPYGKSDFIFSISSFPITLGENKLLWEYLGLCNMYHCFVWVEPICMAWFVAAHGGLWRLGGVGVKTLYISVCSRDGRA